MLDQIIHKHLRLPYTLHFESSRARRSAKATVVFIHGLGESGKIWQPVIQTLPEDIKVYTIDLLGFGKSPKPDWAKYDAKLQARSVGVTLLKHLAGKKLIVVGHSLGALVAVELAKRYPVLVSHLILCSPPFYRQSQKGKVRKRDDRLLSLYQSIHRNPERFVELSQLAVKYRLANEAFDLSRDSLGSYMSALESSIINQTSLSDAIELNHPIQIIHGALDPLVIKKNLVYLTKQNPLAKLKVIAAGHDIKRGAYARAVTSAVNQAAGQEPTSKKQSR